MSNGQRRAEGEKGPYLHSFSFVQLYPIFFFFFLSEHQATLRLSSGVKRERGEE